MKTKKVILGLAVFVFAIGAAFASSLALTDIWVKAQRVEEGAFVCTELNRQCEATGSDPCTVEVNLVGFSKKNTSKTYDDSGCSTPFLKHNTTGTVLNASAADGNPIYDVEN